MSPVHVTKMRWGWVRNNLLLILTFLGVICGLSLGFALRPLQMDKTTILLLAYPGELFIRMLKLMILPLVIASLIAGSASLNARASGKIMVRTVCYFLATSLACALLGIALALAIHPGSPVTKKALELDFSGEQNGKNPNANILDGFLDLGRNIFPDNLFQASFQQAQTVYVPKTAPKDANETTLQSEQETASDLVRKVHYISGTNTLGIIVFCLVFGTILGSMGKKGAVVVQFFDAVDAVVLKIVTGIMWMSPLGVCSVIMNKILIVADIATVMSNLGLFIVTVTLGVMIWQLVLQNILYFIFVRKNPITFYFNLLEAWVTAFATASTAATLPITFRCMNDKCKVDPRINKFVLPIGATVNMDGTALFVAIGTVFIAQMNEQPLDLGQYVTIAITATAASIASASVPSAALVLILIVLTSVQLPAKDVSLLFTIDWLVDRFRTTNNLLGDCYTAAIVEKWSADELRGMDGGGSTSSAMDIDQLEKVEDQTPLMVEVTAPSTKTMSVNEHLVACKATAMCNGEAKNVNIEMKNGGSPMKE